ncbi:MAG TPA: hypothetical protein VN455_11860 [Methanotrichaceae archaeon]|nr:hypothetical protein [Methanotrichaceae archaeon]
MYLEHRVRHNGPIGDLKFIGFLLFLALVQVPVSADVSITNGYYSYVSEVHDTLMLHNMDYKNQVTIKPTYIMAVSKANVSNTSEPSTAENSIGITSLEGQVSAFADIAGDTLFYNKSIFGGDASGSDAAAQVDYQMSSGHALMAIQNKDMSSSEEVVSNEGMLTSSISGTVSQIQSNTVCYALKVGQPIGFSDDLRIRYFNRSAEMKGNLSAIGEILEGNPPKYSWNTLVAGDQSSATAMMQIVGYTGNRNLTFRIRGTSSDLSDKIAGPVLLVHRDPNKMNKSFIGSQNLLMIYTLRHS